MNAKRREYMVSVFSVLVFQSSASPVSVLDVLLWIVFCNGLSDHFCLLQNRVVVEIM